MSVVVEENQLVRTLTIQEKGQKIKQTVEEVLKEVSKEVSLKGFRKGHVPKSIIMARYKEHIQDEVARKFIEENLPKILEKEGLTPVTQIFFGDVELKGEDELKLKVSFEIAPEFELKEYEGLNVEVVKKEVKEEDINKVIENLLNQNVTYEPADKEIEQGDKIKIRYHIISKEGEEEEDEFEVVLGSGALRQEIEEKLIGKKKGDTIEIKDISLLDEQGNEKGKADVTITILEVYKKVLPQFNDEFVKKIGLGETAEEAKQKIKEDLEKRFKEDEKREIEQKIIDELIKEYDFPVPQTLVEAELEALLQDYARQLQSFGIQPNQDMLLTAKENLIPTAQKNVRLMFIINKIAEKENIEVTEEEINEEISKLAKAYNTTPEEIRRTLEEQGLLPNITFGILRKKVLEKIAEKANIKEISREEFEKRMKEQQQQEKTQAQQKEENQTTEKKE
ncbi:MAG: trigger factor [Aquificae bacterium]|nr:trigger factor [Aquificota bacterium]